MKGISIGSLLVTLLALVTIGPKERHALAQTLQDGRDRQEPEKASSECARIAVANVLGKIFLEHDAEKANSALSLHSTSDPSAIRDPFVVEPVRPQLSTFAVVPKSDIEFTQIFQAIPSISSLRKMSKWNVLSADLDSQAVGYPRTRAGFVRFLNETSSRFITIIGHNANGIFYFADGSNLNLSEMVTLARDSRKRLIILSCNSKVYVSDEDADGLRSVVSYDEALHIARDLERYFETHARSGHPLSYADVAANIPALIRASNRDARIKYRVAFISKKVAGTAGVAGLLVATRIVLEQGEQGDDCAQSGATHLSESELRSSAKKSVSPTSPSALGTETRASVNVEILIDETGKVVDARRVPSRLLKKSEFVRFLGPAGPQPHCLQHRISRMRFGKPFFSNLLG
jgi:hypothetical protein